MDKDTRAVIDIFEQISAVPRQSKHEEQITRWVCEWAAERGFEHKTDKAGNVLIRVPASSGYEPAPTVIIQGHLDMVCEKTPDSDHDFLKDPIKLVYDGEWLTADKTTLGADNGIAVAMALAVAAGAAATGGGKHPALELLFTVDEETGLTGANALTADFLDGRLLINLDSEDEGVFTIGCAGGSDAVLSFETEKREVNSGAKGMEIVVGGLAGGHSGAEIHKRLANANKLLARTLAPLLGDSAAAIVSMSGGSVRNAIPRDARAVLAMPVDQVSRSLKHVEDCQKTYRAEYGAADPDITISADPVSLDGTTSYSPEFSRRIVSLLRVLPNGAQEYSADIHGLVETSCNMAVIKEGNGTLEIHSSQRSSVMSKLADLTRVIQDAGKLAGAAVRGENKYPAWTPNTESKLLERAKSVFISTFNTEPRIEAIHAGLECGVIGSKYPGMDMVSFGPTIQYAHSPDERILISSISNTWKFLAALLASFK